MKYSGTIQPTAGDKAVHTLLKGISPKVNGIVQMEFDFTYYTVPAQHVSHHATSLDLWGPRINQLHFCKEVRPPPHTHTHQRQSRIEHNQSDGESPINLELSGIRNTSSLPLHPGSL